MPPPLAVSLLAARRFMRQATRLDQPLPDVADALAYHGYIQIDPINVCGRMHDLILRNRVAGYRQGDLMRHLHGELEPDGAHDPPAPPAPQHAIRAGAARTFGTRPAETRTAFEHHLPDTGVLVAFPLEAWPYLRAAMQARTRHRSAWSGRLTPRERTLVPQLLAEIAARGPLGAEDFEDERRAHRAVWGTATLVKSTLQKLFFHGELLIAGRANNRRRYHLPDRVLPTEVLRRSAAVHSDTSRWLALLKLRQRRLVRLKRDEVRHAEDAVRAVRVEGCPPLFCLRADEPLLALASEGSSRTDEVAAPGWSDGFPGTSRPGGEPAGALALLAPLDPLIYDRSVTATVWDFDYTWEVYTPPARRVRGYYALPLLAGTEIVGYVDAKADREKGQLEIVSRRVRRGYSISPALRVFATWLGLRR